jgi:hypothetical protein
MRKLSVSGISEPEVRDNFKAIEMEMKDSPIFAGRWRFFDQTYPVGVFKLFHKLGYAPKDFIETYSTATYTTGIDTATREYIELNVTVAGRIRFLLGRMD